ncbi:MAG TPA: hypothetical protein VE775_08645 [Pyrinomonadaceae bacterium]|nr:hypothetical protein [Pyrinomonadaceae bacterium]
MKRMTYAGLTACSLLALLMAVAALSIAAATNTRAEDAQGRDKAELRTWEYVAISEVKEVGRASVASNLKFSGVAVICYMRESGCQQMPVEGADKANALAMAMTHLGNEGWELVGESPVPFAHETQGGWYFKRPKK